jgi:hypothetical protein
MTERPIRRAVSLLAAFTGTLALAGFASARTAQPALAATPSRASATASRTSVVMATQALADPIPLTLTDTS